MDRITYEDLLAHPELIDAIHAAARRERALEFDRLVIAPLRAALHAERATPVPAGLKYRGA